MAIELASARIITARELSRDTAAVLNELNEKNEPAIVSRHGKFVALLTPLAGAKLELHALQALSSELPTGSDIDDDEAHGGSVSLDDVSPDEP